MRSLVKFVVFFMCILAAKVSSQTYDVKAINNKFSALYEKELGSTRPCTKQISGEFKACSKALKNEGNAPYILHAKSPKALIVLGHGLSDSPFFVRSIAEYLHRHSYTVFAPLMPGHGKLVADLDMQDPILLERWQTHLSEVMDIAFFEDLPVFIGGFSTGGTLATQYTLEKPERVKGLLLFSGALQLSDNAEAISRIWGSRWVAKIIDGDYQTDGPNPYKYPQISLFSAIVLMDVINDIRDRLDKFDDANEVFKMPIFAAHSLFDKTTLIEGIDDLMSRVEGAHSLMKIDESYQLCHADLPLSSVQIVQMKFNKALVKEYETCAVPAANPLHLNMLKMLNHFIEQGIQN